MNLTYCFREKFLYSALYEIFLQYCVHWWSISAVKMKSICLGKTNVNYEYYRRRVKYNQSISLYMLQNVNLFHMDWSISYLPCNPTLYNCKFGNESDTELICHCHCNSCYVASGTFRLLHANDLLLWSFDRVRRLGTRLSALSQ